jgi:PAS domain S-box-containing protein
MLRLALDPIWGVRLPYITLFPAIMVSAWLGGGWPGIITTALCGTAAEYFWIEPSRSWAVTDKSELLGLLLFIVVGVVISALNEAWRRGTVAIAESEQRLSVTLSSIGDGVLTTDEQGRVVGVNAVAEALTGWTEGDAVGRRLEEIFVIINEETRRPTENPIGKVLRDNVIVGLANHTVLISKDGREIPIDDSAAPIRTADGVVTGVILVFRDVTERRQAERERVALLEQEQAARTESERRAEELRQLLTERKEAEERFRLAIEAAPTAMIMVDQQGTIVLANTLTDQMLGYGRDEIVGCSIEQLVPSRFRDRHLNHRTSFLADAHQRPMGAGMDLYALHKNGSEIPVEIGLSPIETADGVFVLAAVTDITARRHIEDERERLLVREQTARAEMERASRLKDEFLAVLSHELRTPLNAVLGYAHLLNSGVLPPERASHALDAIQRNAHAQARLVESLLDLSRVMAGKLELNLEELNLATIVNAAVDALRPGAEEKGIAIDAVVPPMPIVADGGRLQQVFWNLLSNAIKFSDRGGRVAIRCTEEDAQVRVQVTDNGQGIRADFLPYVFDRFSQADGQTRRSRTGLGLGLALVREMVQAHGGTVVAESPGEGRGSRFTVTLPLSIGSFAHGSPKTSAPQPDAPESLPPIEILIVDDDGDVRDLLALLLESRGAIARTVSSASEALDAISQRRPDVLLADLRMPDEDGYSLIRKVRAREREQEEGRLPAIAVTAYASPSDRDKAIAAGFDLHVAKPVEPADLARAVATVASGLSPKNEAV